MSNPNGICVRNCKITGFPDFDSIKDLPEGTLVEFIVTQGEEQIIRVFTYDNRTIKREKPLYITSGDNLQLIDKELWPFLTAIFNAEERLKLVKNHQLVEFISNKVKVNDEVFIKSETTGDDYVRGIVKYIALVPELGSGFYFGVEIPEKKLIIPNQSFTDKSIRLTVVVSAQMIKPAENYSNNNSSLIDFQQEVYNQNYKANQSVGNSVLKRRSSREHAEDEYTKNQKISSNMENTFEKFIESKNVQMDSLIDIDDCFSQMNMGGSTVKEESLKMVAETTQKFEERANEIEAEKKATLKKKYDSLNRRKSEEKEKALSRFDCEMEAQKKAVLKKKNENLNRRKSEQTDKALFKFDCDEKLNMRKSFEAKKSSDNAIGDLEKHLELMKAYETTLAQENMLTERKKKLQSEYNPRNTKESDDSYLNLKSADELKKIGAEAKKLKKAREAKESKEQAAKLLAERQQKFNSVYSPDKIGMTADSIVKISQCDKNRNSITKNSTTSSDMAEKHKAVPQGFPKSTGAIKKNSNGNQYENPKSNKQPIDEFEYYFLQHERSKALQNEEINGATSLPDHLKHLFSPNPTDWICEQCTYLNSINDIKCAACNREVVSEIPNNYKDFIEIGEVPMIIEDADISSEFIDDDHDVVPNRDEVQCSVCDKICLPGVGVILRDCIHSFCRECLKKHIIETLNFEIKCPFKQDYTCDSNLQDREIKGIVGQDIYNAYLTKSAFEIQRDVNIFQCRKENCEGYGLPYESIMVCPICNSRNCIICTAIHSGMSCAEFFEKNDNKTFTKVEKKKENKTLSLRPQQFKIPPEDFYCKVCERIVKCQMGVFMEKCSHAICFACLQKCLLRANKKDVKCPIEDCTGYIEHFFKRQILTTRQLEDYINRVNYNFDCTAENCDGWFTLSKTAPKGNKQKCPKCKAINCITCKAIHFEMNCKEYKKKSLSFMKGIFNK